MVQAGPAASGREGIKVSSMLHLQEISALLNDAGETKVPCVCSEFPEDSAAAISSSRLEGTAKMPCRQPTALELSMKCMAEFRTNKKPMEKSRMTSALALPRLN